MQDPGKPALVIYDMPESQGQIHIHGDAICGGVHDYGRTIFRPLNAYESAMADFNAQQLGLPKIKP